ncbi:APC amino acid permease [Pyrrhoderma noxium]|uniref:APC amino acid permease n=1 Tax=Pyrrhoderma noxium TaxID=2282107 RepID=A0A286UIH2_9AGAM|nr:APC amino acid permease [Pyrrhoderma noxium]
MSSSIQHRDEQRLQDEEQLASLGYKQELKRDYSPVELFGFSFGFLGIVATYRCVVWYLNFNTRTEGLSSVLVYAIPNGGPVSMVWGWFAASIFLTLIGLVVGELGSAMPMCGGLYFWTYRFSSPRYRNLLAWIVGYTNSFAYITGVAGVDWALAVQIMAAVTIGTDSRFIPTAHQTYGLYCGLVFTHCLIGNLATRVLAKLTFAYITINILLLLAIIIGVPAATPAEYKNTASFALGGYLNFYGWPSGFAFILSFLAPIWTVAGFDSSVHISEEARNAKTAVPWAVISNTVSGCVLGWVLNIAIAFNMGSDMDSILNSPIGQPMATILLSSFGKKGTLVVWSFVIVSQFMVGISTITVASRLVFSFARDGGYPFSKFLYHINTRSGAPTYCVWISGILAMLLGLLSFAGPLATEAIFTVSIVAQFVSIATPIAARYLGSQEFVPGPFSLGILSKPLAVISSLWMAFMAIVLLFPATPQISPGTMNYSVVILGGVMLLALIYYYLPVYGGIHWFTGPVSTIDSNETANTSVEMVADVEKKLEYVDN